MTSITFSNEAQERQTITFPTVRIKTALKYLAASITENIIIHNIVKVN